jgi:transcriptional regulator with XRE-family HTH domain
MGAIVMDFLALDSFSVTTIKTIMSIHQRIKQGREALGLNQQQFADKLGLSRGTVQQWENEGGTAPSRKHQPQVAALLGLSVAQLMDPADTAAQPSTRPGDLSAAAYELAKLFDMLPADRIQRTVAYNEATAAILRVLQSHGGQPKALPAPGVLAKTPRA